VANGQKYKDDFHIGLAFVVVVVVVGVLVVVVVVVVFMLFCFVGLVSGCIIE
jgi:hypothetical protein